MPRHGRPPCGCANMHARTRMLQRKRAAKGLAKRGGWAEGSAPLQSAMAICTPWRASLLLASLYQSCTLSDGARYKAAHNTTQYNQPSRAAAAHNTTSRAAGFSTLVAEGNTRAYRAYCQRPGSMHCAFFTCARFQALQDDAWYVA